MQTQENFGEPPLSKAQQELLEAAVTRSSLPIEEVASQSDDIRSLIQAGLLRLAVVVNLWGADYDLSPTVLGFELIGSLARSGGEAV